MLGLCANCLAARWTPCECPVLLTEGHPGISRHKALLHLPAQSKVLCMHGNWPWVATPTAKHEQ
jgi:hypothetical protein